MFAGKVELNGIDISDIYINYQSNINLQMFNNTFKSDSENAPKFEDEVERYVVDQFPDNISQTQKTLYVGTLSSLLWMNKDSWSKQPPEKVAIKQKDDGNFKSWVR